MNDFFLLTHYPIQYGKNSDRMTKSRLLHSIRTTTPLDVPCSDLGPKASSVCRGNEASVKRLLIIVEGENRNTYKKRSPKRIEA